MAATLKTWTHPTTGEKRVYVSGLAGQSYGDKVWFATQAKDAFGCNWQVHVKCLRDGRPLRQQADELIGASMAACAAVSFEQIVARGV